MFNFSQKKETTYQGSLSDKNKELNIRLEAIAEVNRMLSGVIDRQEVFDLITKKLAPLVKMNFPTIWVYDEKTELISLESHSVPDSIRLIAEKAIGKPIKELGFSRKNPEERRSTYFKVLDTGKPVFGSDLYEHTYPFLNKQVAGILSKLSGMQLAVSVPILVKGKPLGVLSAIWQDKELSKENELTLFTFANQISTAIYNSQLFEQVSKQVHVLEAKNREQASLFNLTAQISKSLDPAQVAQNAVDSLPLDKFMMGGILLNYDKAKNSTSLMAVTQSQFLHKVKSLLGDLSKYSSNYEDEKYAKSPIYQVIRSGEPYFSNDVNAYLSPPIPKQLLPVIDKILQIQSLAVFPIYHRGEIVAIASYFLKEKKAEELTESEKQLLATYTNQISIALENAQLYETTIETQQNLERTLKELELARRHERDMIDIMGHELRTPLSIVRNALVMMEMQLKTSQNGENAKLKKYVDMGLESARREVKLVETLLSATKADGKGFQLLLEKVDLVDVVNDSITAFVDEAKKKGLAIKFEPPSESLYVYADRTRIQEISDNFLSNAVKYTLKGEVVIELRQDNNFGYVSYRDTGIGITEEDKKQLGTKFFRARQYSQEEEMTEVTQADIDIIRPGGTGLGLYVTFNLVKLLDGKVELESKIGEGSTFIFSIPLYTGQPSKQIDRKVSEE